MKKLLLVIIILLIGLGVRPFFAISENEGTGSNNDEIEQLNKEIAAKREKIKQLEQSIADYKEKISKKRTEAVSLNNQIAILDNRATQIEIDIEKTEETLETIKLEIEALQLGIEEKAKTIDKQKAIISELLRHMNQEEGKSMVEIFALYDNFSDFYNQLQYVETVENDVGKNARALTLAKANLEEKKMNNEERKQAYNTTMEELKEKQQDYEEQIGLKQNLLIKTQASEMTYQTLMSNLKKQYQQIEGEIVGIEQEVRKKLEAQDKLDNIDVNFDGKLSWPTQSRYITSRFHDPDYPYRHIFEHNGIDIRASHGTPLKAAASGYVGRAKYCQSSSCYSYVMIIHSGGLSTVYGHMSQITVKGDQFVTRGDIIGYSGGTPGTVGAGPFVTGPHLHFEVRKNGIPINPLNYLVKDW